MCRGLSLSDAEQTVTGSWFGDTAHIHGPLGQHGTPESPSLKHSDWVIQLQTGQKSISSLPVQDSLYQ